MTVLAARSLDEGTRERFQAQAIVHKRSIGVDARAMPAAAVAPLDTALSSGSRIVALFHDEPTPAFARAGEIAQAAEFLA